MPPTTRDHAVIDCPHAARCGGCVLIELSAADQHAHKRQRVQAAVSAYPQLGELSAGELVPAEPALAYRTRAKLVVSPLGQIGLYARGSHDVVDIPQCQVLAPSLMSVLAELRACLPAPISAVDVREVRDGTEEHVLVTLIGPATARRAIVPLAERLAEHPQVAGVAWSARDDDAVQLLGSTPEVLVGRDAARDRIADDGPYHYAAHGGFTQAHRGQAAKLLEQVIAELRAALGDLRGARVLELYAGAGALGLRLAQQGAEALLVERFEPALAHAARAAREQELAGLEVRAQAAELALEQLLRARAHFDAVVVNPPRRGLTPRVRGLLARLAPRAVVYVSCDPETLARDLADLAQQGLRVRTFTPYDMLPMAADVETLAALRPAAPSGVRVLYEDADVLVVDKPPHLPSVPHPEHAHSLLALLQQTRGLPELRPVHRLDLGTSGVCLFAKSAESTARYARALAAGHKSYVALVRGRTHDKGNVRKPLAEDGRSREALTRYSRRAVVAGHTLVRARPVEGRTHQVRRHLAAIGHPVLGDARYGDAASNRYFEHKHGLDRTFLHLERVELDLPGRDPLCVEAPLAPDLAAVLRSAGHG